MIPGIQTHIEGWTDPEELAQVRLFGFTLGRISAMTCTADMMAACIDDAHAANLRPFITIAEAHRMRLRPGRDYECRNEDDGDLSPREYRRILEEMAVVAIETGSRLWGPTCSNTNRKCIRWATEVRGAGWPQGMHGLSWHSYDPHENTLFSEMETLAEGKPICISEFGYPSLGVSEEEQAKKARELWARYAKYDAAIWFQLHDGPNPREREHCYGIRRTNAGAWKPAAYTVPVAAPVDPIPEGEPCMISYADRPLFCGTGPTGWLPGNLVPKPGASNEYAIQKPNGKHVAVTPTGEYEERDAGTFGAYETLKIADANLTINYVHDGTVYIHVIPFVRL